MADFFVDDVTHLHIPEANAVTIGNIPVEVENPITNQVLAFENNKWVNMSGGGGSDASSILNVPVTFTSPADGDVIAFNGTTSLKNKTLFPLTNSNLSSMSAGTWKGNPTGSSHIPYDVAVGNLSESTSNVLTITGGSGALLNNATIQVQQASSTLPGYVSAADYVRFGTASGGITALTGDVTATGPGSSVATVSNATVTGKVLTGYIPSAGSIAATDSVLSALQKTGGSLGTSAGQVVLGNASDVATPTTITGDVSLTNAGVATVNVTGKTLTGYAASPGNLTSSDTILTGFGKVGASLAASSGQVILGNSSNVATPTTVSGDLSISNTGVTTVNVTGKVLTGYVASSGSVTATDTVLTGFQKMGGSLATSPAQIVLGSSLGIATPTTVSGDVTLSNSGLVTLKDASVTGKSLTGFSSSSGTVSTSDTVLTGFGKLAGSLNTFPSQVVLGNASSVATPTNLSGDVAISNTGVTTLSNAAVIGKLLTGYTPTAGKVSSSDSLLQGFNKVGNSLNTATGQIIVGNSSGVATPVAMSGAVTIDNAGVTSLTPTGITSTLLTGYAPTTGKVATSDSILEGFNKVGNSLNTTSAQIIVGNASGVASPVTMSGAVTIDNVGVTSLTPVGITSTLLTGYTPTAGKVAATDSILQGINKVGNSLNTSSGQIIVGNASGVATPVAMSGAITINNAGVTSLTPTGITSTLLTGYTPTAGKVAATDSILEGVNKIGNSLNASSGQILVGNSSGIATPVAMSGAVTIDNAGVTSLTPTGITSTLLTGYTPTAGKVSATDSILQGVNKIGNSLNTSSAQIIVGNASGVATPVTMSGAVTIDNAGVTSLSPTGITSTLLTGYTPTAGKVSATDTILQGLNKVGNSLNATSAQIIVGNSSGVASPVTMSGAVTIDNTGATSLSTPVTSTLLTGYTATAGKVVATDTLLSSVNKMGGSLNTTAGQIVVGNSSGIASPVTMSGAVTIDNVGVTSLSPTGITSTLLTGYTPTAGKVSATDSILQGINKVGNSLNATSGQIIVGNGSGIATPVTMSGAVTIDNAGATTLSATGVTSTLLTGYTPTAGKLASTDTILQGLNKVGNSMNTTSGQIIVGNASGVATPVTLSGVVAVDNTGVTSFSSPIISSSLTGYTPTAGKVTATDTILQGFNKVGNSLNTTAGQLVVGNSSGVATPVTMSGDVTLNSSGVTSRATPVTSTLLTGYTPTAGTISAVDTILQGINKVGNSLNTSSAQIIVGNAYNVATPVTVTGVISLNNSGVTSFSTPITSIALTGYTPTAGKVTAVDSILDGFNKVGNSLNTSSAQIIVGNSSGVATPVTMSGAVTIDNAGVTSLTPTGITSTLLTGYAPAAGKVSSSDSLLQGFNKVGNSLNTTSAQIIVGNSSGVATPVTMSGAVTIDDTGVTSLTPTGITSTLLTGYTPTTGKVAATDSILQGINKVGNSLNTTAGQIIVGNSSGVASPVTMSGAITIDNAGVTSLAPTGITSTLLTGYTPTTGTIAATDSILQGINKVGASLNTTAGQIIVGNSSGVATPVTMSGAVTIDNTGATSLTPTGITSTLLTGYTPTAGKVIATDSILQGINKVGNSLDATSGQVLVGNASNVVTPVAMSGDVTISNTGATSVANSAVIGKVLTGYTVTAGKISASDSLLQAVQKTGSSLNATSGQVILGNASNVATPTSVTGDVTLSDTGVSTISSNVVTNAKSAQMAAYTLKGNNTASTANASDLTVAQVTSLISSTTPAASTIPQADANKNLTVNNLIIGSTSTATAAGTTVLTVGSTGTQIFTGTTTQIIRLPVANTLASGTTFTIINNSTGVLTINDSTGTYECTVNANSFLRIVVVSTATAAGIWTWQAAFPVTVNAYLPITATFSPSLQLGNLLVRLATNNGFQLAGVTAFTADITGSGNYTVTPFGYYGSAVYSASVTTTFTNVLGWNSSGNAGNMSKIFIKDITNNNKVYEINMVFFGPAGTAPLSSFLSITQWV